jgi:hypothetical protein
LAPVAGVDSAEEQKKTRSQKMLAVGAARREAAVPSIQCIIPAIVRDVVLGGGVVDESPIYALLTNSRWNPMDFFMFKRSIS